MAEGRDDRLRYAREGLRRDKFGNRRAPCSKAALIGSTNATWEKAQAHIRELEEEVKLLKNLLHHNIVKRYLGTVREEDTLNILLHFVPHPLRAAVRLSPLRPPCRRRELLCYLLPISTTRFSRPDPEQGVNKLVLEASPSFRKDNCSRHRRRHLWSSTPLPSCMRACSIFSIQDYANGELCQTRRYDDYAYMPLTECGEMVVSKAMSLLLRLQLEMYLVQMVIIVLKDLDLYMVPVCCCRFVGVDLL